MFTLKFLFDEVGRGFGHGKKHIVRYHLYVFLKKTVMTDLN